MQIIFHNLYWGIYWGMCVPRGNFPSPKSSPRRPRAKGHRKYGTPGWCFAEPLFFYLFSRRLLERFFAIFCGFWEAKWKRKSIFGKFIFNVFFECVFASILGSFLEVRNLKNSNFASTGARFLQNRRFRKRSNKIQIWDHFWRPK